MLLRRGFRGRKVTELQKLLNAVNWHVQVDGQFGLGTEAAVRCFQVQNHLTNDGLVGNRTLSMLGGKASYPSTPTAPVSAALRSHKAFRCTILRCSLRRLTSEAKESILHRSMCSSAKMAMQSYTCSKKDQNLPSDKFTRSQSQCSNNNKHGRPDYH